MAGSGAGKKNGMSLPDLQFCTAANHRYYTQSRVSVPDIMKECPAYCTVKITFIPRNDDLKNFHCTPGYLRISLAVVCRVCMSHFFFFFSRFFINVFPIPILTKLKYQLVGITILRKVKRRFMVQTHESKFTTSRIWQKCSNLARMNF